MTVLNAAKPGPDEKAYENALVVELQKRGHQVDQQERFRVSCESVPVDPLVPELIVDQLVVVDPKVIDEFTPTPVAKMIGYLAVTGLHLALLLNFKHADLRWRRIVRLSAVTTDSTDLHGQDSDRSVPIRAIRGQYRPKSKRPDLPRFAVYVVG